MASSTPPLESSAARERGNGYYRKGQFTEAEKAYREAAALAPEDPAPWSNISAIKFEQGDYTSCLQNLEKALSFSLSDAKDEPKKQKLYTRMAKCHMHLMSFEAAESAIESLGVDTSSQSLKASLEDHKGLRDSVQDSDKLRTQTCDRVARYKASLQDIPECYAVGHDFAEPLLQLDEPLWELLGPKDTLSFLLCGSGDARHLFVSIATLFFQDMMSQRKGKNKAFAQAYFTIIDINAAALARTVIMFDMGFRYAAMKTQKMPRSEDALTVMSYISKAELLKHIDTHWVTNPTVLDMDYQPRRDILSTEKEEDVLKIFPREYDRIHMSNIPDYIGGPLAAFLTGGPLLRQDRPSNLRFKNLLNPPMFKSHDQFLAEYVLMHDAKEVESNFGVTREKNPNPPEVDEAALQQMFGGNKFAIEDYFIWAKSSTKTTLSKRLMSRSALERCLYLHLLKICLPYPRPKLSDRPVHAPLNLTTFLRIVGHMHDVGYPAHWLSGVISSVCEGSISTTARPPRELVVSPEILSTCYPQRKICLNPWRAEFTTLLSLWVGLSPFGIIAPESALVPAEKVVECTVAFPGFFEAQGRVMHFVLAIFNTTEVDPRNFDLRELLSDDEDGNSSDSARKFRENSVHIVTAFRFSTATRTATFWMRQDVLDEFTSTDSWQICICRTDSWEEVSSRVSASESMSRIGTWSASSVVH
ncbi:Hsp70-Hsp90 organizing protein 1 [Colletotrichum sp. SAR 10_96]|nr:Hsp70-Hsp90 organizing protein 1 [Colletotrichum sp. SAR 10_96]